MFALNPCSGQHEAALRANIVLCVDREFPFPVEFLCYPTHYLSDRALYGNIQQYHWVRVFGKIGEN